MNDTLHLLISRIARIFLTIFSVWLLYYIGLKGLLGFSIGVMITSYLFYSNNPTILFIMQGLGLRKKYETAQAIYNPENKHKVKFKGVNNETEN